MENKVGLLRRKQGMSQGEFAKKVGVSRQTISSIENGKYNPSLELAFKIAIYFETSIEKVFQYKEEN